MSESKVSDSKRGVVIGLVVVAILAGGSFGAYALFGSGIERDLASGEPDRMVGALSKFDNEQFNSEDNAELRGRTLAAMKKASFDELFDLMRSDDITDQERENLEANMRDLMMEDMNNKVDEYNDASEEEKEAILDRHIDEMNEFWAKMREYDEKHKDDPDYQEDKENRMARRRNPSKQDRKNWMEGGNPDRRVKMFKYWGKMMTRMQERGMGFGGMRGRR